MRMIARVKLHEVEGVQTLFIPSELALAASEVFLTKEGSKITIEPVMITDRSSFFEWLKTVEPWDGPAPELTDPAPEEIKL